MVESADVIIVTVDTPSIMERTNFRNTVMKNAEMLSKYLKAYVCDSSKPELIVFVPTKCEKYYYEGRLNAVSDKIWETYKNFFEGYKCISENTDIHDYFLSKKNAIISPVIIASSVRFERYESYNDIDSAKFTVDTKDYFDHRKFAENILIGIANFLTVKGFVEAEVLEKHDTEDRVMAWTTLVAKMTGALYGVKTPFLKVDVNHLLNKGKFKKVQSEVLIDAEFVSGYREYYR